ncbi:MAG: cryptochrome/photolyase family protein [Pseudomonadota bacterium]
MSNKLLLVAGNQLFDPSHLADHRDAVVLMCESDDYCARIPSHQQKLGFVLSAMRAHAEALEAAGFDVRYHRLAESRSFADLLPEYANRLGARKLYHFDSEDRGFIKGISRTAKAIGLRREVIRTPMFLLDNKTVDGYFQESRNPRMAGFYKSQRLRMGLLIDEQRQPLGGKWSFDAQNRSKLPRHQALPELPAPTHSADTRACLEEIAVRFPTHPGNARDLWLPVDRAGALRWLDRFLEERLLGFGTYEDAITSRSSTLFHSVLSPFLNVGLITPDEVVSRAMDAGESLQVPLNDLEGFIRQVVGWREFIRGAYRTHRHTMRKRNVWGGERTLTPEWLEGNTGIPPLDHAIRTAIDYGWNHHIERLMVIANLMNLAEIHPQEVYQFFMTHYIDAYDWVMVPNVYGMGLTSDGGIFTSKPYICGSNYIRKMSDFPAGEWTDVMDGLYWRFVAKHRPVLATNPRLAMMTRGLDRMEPARLRRILGAAEDFIGTTTQRAA